MMIARVIEIDEAAMGGRENGSLSLQLAGNELARQDGTGQGTRRL